MIRISLESLKGVEENAIESQSKPPPSTKVVGEKIRRCVCRFFTLKTLKRRVPIVAWLPHYNLHKLQNDAIAGITVGLTVIPQGMAYASVAGLPLQYGLYSAFMSCFMYCIFGSTKEVTIGPTAIMGLLTHEQVDKGGNGYAVILCFLSGVIELLFGVLNLGFLIDFISAPVISGFSSAAALIISATQIKGLMGLKFKADHFLEVIYNVGLHIKETRPWDLILGLSCMLVLLLLRKLNSMPWKNENPSQAEKIFRKAVWLLCTGRNALIVVIAAFVSYILHVHGIDELNLTGNIEPGIPKFQLPPFTVEVENRTENILYIISDLGSSLGLVPLLAILEHIAIAKVFAQSLRLDSTQELIALGVSNIMGSFVSSFPGTGSFSRTALNNSSGVKTAFGGVFTGVIVLFALGLLTTTFQWIPKATLSAVIISTVIFMIEYEMVPHLWKTNKFDFVILATTFLSCIFLGAEFGIVIGIGVSLLILLYKTARPTIVMEKSQTSDAEYIIVKSDRTLYFPAMEYLKYRVNKVSSTDMAIPVVFDGSYLTGTDYTIAQSIKQLTAEFKNRNQKLVFTHLRPEVINIIENMNPEEFQHCKTTEEFEALLKAKVRKSLPNVSEEILSPLRPILLENGIAESEALMATDIPSSVSENPVPEQTDTQQENQPEAEQPDNKEEQLPK